MRVYFVFPGSQGLGLRGLGFRADGQDCWREKWALADHKR